MKAFALGMSMILMASCGNVEVSKLDRIPDYEYKDCPLLDLNGSKLIESKVSGVYEGLGARYKVGPVGIRLVIAEVGAPGKYSYMLNTFPIISNPDVTETCQSGLAYKTSDWKVLGSEFHGKILFGSTSLYNLWLNQDEENDLYGSWGASNYYRDSIVLNGLTKLDMNFDQYINL